MKRSFNLRNSSLSKSMSYMDREQRNAARQARIASRVETALSAPRSRGVMARVADCVLAVPKDARAKPGKVAPTRAERKWLDAITEHGCIACRMDGRGFVPACVHHILRGPVRMGHLWSLPLCPDHHQKDSASGLIARHPDKARFEAEYGRELDLLLDLQRALGFEPLWEGP